MATVRALLVIAALLAAFATGCGSGSGEEAGPTSAATTTTPTETAPPDEASSRPPAPAIAGTTLDGERLSLADLRGRPVLVNVWAAW